MKNIDFKIRKLEEKDNLRIAEIIRACLTEYGYAGRMDTAWGDPELEHFSHVYSADKSAYWVAEDDKGIVVAGVGIGPLPGEMDTCELQKMYCIPEYRGTGIAQDLINLAMKFAMQFYKNCYLETCQEMERAQNFYKKNGFHQITETFGDTGHTGCGSHFIKIFSESI